MNKQQGFTLIELMVSIVIGMLVTSAALSIFVSMLYSNNAQLKAVRLNQELRSAITAIVRDLRRSGFNSNAANLIGSPNPFSLLSTSSTTVTFSYDKNLDGTSIKTFGYRLNIDSSGIGSIQACSANSAACSSSNWQDLTDRELTNITALTFTPTSTVVGGVTLTRMSITLTGNLRKDTAFTRSLTETIQLRN